MIDTAINTLNHLSAYQDIGMLLMRLVLGFAFIMAAYYKSQDIRKFAQANELPPLAACGVMIIEFLAGSTLALGLLAPIGALAIMCLMAGSMSLHVFKWKSPYWANQGGWEYDLMLFTMALVILLTGGGNLAVLPV